MKMSNINLPTSPKWVKIGSVLVTVSTFVGGYGLTQSNTVVGIIGLALGVVGTAIVAFKD